MPVIAGKIDGAGRQFRPDGQETNADVYKTPPQSAVPPERVDLKLYAGCRVAIVCKTANGALWGADEIGALTETTAA